MIELKTTAEVIKMRAAGLVIVIEPILHAGGSDDYVADADERKATCATDDSLGA